jgi:ABC-type transport system involved in multi-copper enzyme maturation permease subunit
VYISSPSSFARSEYKKIIEEISLALEFVQIVLLTAAITDEVDVSVGTRKAEDEGFCFSYYFSYYFFFFLPLTAIFLANSLSTSKKVTRKGWCGVATK